MVEKFSKSNNEYLQKRKQFQEKINIPNLWSIVDQFPLFAGIQTLGNKLAVFEIMKKCLDVPGHIVEFGCWQGANLLFMAKVLQILQPNTYKYIYGFDSFEGLKTFSEKDKNTHSQQGAYAGNEERLIEIIKFFEMEEWVHIIKGNALETISEFEVENPHLLFSLAYIDFDLYEPCKAALKFIDKRLAQNGIIAFDEALTKSWPGEGQALYEFIENEGSGKYEMRNIEFARQPTVYLIKK